MQQLAEHAAMTWSHQLIKAVIQVDPYTRNTPNNCRSIEAARDKLPETRIRNASNDPETTANAVNATSSSPYHYKTRKHV